MLIFFKSKLSNISISKLAHFAKWKGLYMLEALLKVPEYPGTDLGFSRGGGGVVSIYWRPRRL